MKNNAKDEFIEDTKEVINLLVCAVLAFNANDPKDPNKTNNVILKEGFTPFDYQTFLAQINREYYNYELSGYIWLSDGRWFERRDIEEYEYWELCSIPVIPDICKD